MSGPTIFVLTVVLSILVLIVGWLLGSLLVWLLAPLVRRVSDALAGWWVERSKGKLQ